MSRKAVSVVITTILGTAALVTPTSGSASNASRAAAAAAPPAQVLGTPVLITVNGKVSVDRPTAYVFFRLSKHLHEPRLIVAQVKGKSGRTYAVRATSVKNCYKSALLLEGSPAGHLTAGATYRVAFVARSTAHEPTTGKAPFKSFMLKAQSRASAGHVGASACPR